MTNVAIIAIIYEEPEWQETRKCLDKIQCLKLYVDRQGTGSLAAAYNKGYRDLMAYAAANNIQIDYVWFVSNPTFLPGTMERLVSAMDSTGYAAIHPAFNSDHKHLRPVPELKEANVKREVPYIEFTAPIVRADVFAKFPLDEQMPYWGHDLDWSYRVRKDGYILAVHSGVRIEHTYIRNSKPHPVTQRRHQLRKQTNAATTAHLVELYGADWQTVLQYKP